MLRRAHDSIRPAQFHYPDSHQITLDGSRAGTVNFSRLPEVVSAEDVRLQLLEPIGPSLGAIVLPPQPGSHVVDTNDDRRRALRINAFRDESSDKYKVTAYVLATDPALEQISAQSATNQKSGTPMEGQGIITLHEGDRLLVGKDYWLPAVGTHVDLLHSDAKLARLYAGTHSDQGEFRVEQGELLYEDHGYKNRADLIHGGLESEHKAEQSFVQTGKIAVGSVMQSPAEVPGLHDATSH